MLFSAKPKEPAPEPPPAAFRLSVCPGTDADGPVLCVALYDGTAYDVRAEALPPRTPLHRIVEQAAEIAAAAGDPAAVLVLSDETDVGAVLTAMLSERGLRATSCSVIASTASPSPWKSGALEVGERALVAQWRVLLQQGLVTVVPGSDIEALKRPLGIRAAALACWLGREGAAARSGGSVGFVRMMGRARRGRRI